MMIPVSNHTTAATVAPGPAVRVQWARDVSDPSGVYHQVHRWQSASGPYLFAPQARCGHRASIAWLPWLTRGQQTDPEHAARCPFCAGLEGA